MSGPGGTEGKVGGNTEEALGWGGVEMKDWTGKGSRVMTVQAQLLSASASVDVHMVSVICYISLFWSHGISNWIIPYSERKVLDR